MRFRPPKEHGTWGMFFIPFAVGWAAAGHTNWAVLLTLLSGAALFFSRESLLFWWRARYYRRDPEGSGAEVLAYAVVAAVFAAPLILAYRLYALIPLGAFGAAALLVTAELAVRRQGRTVLTEFLAVATAAMNAAAAHIAATGRWTAEAAWVWALSALYFGSSIFYVKLRVQDAHGKTPGAVAAARRRCALYHALLSAALIAAAAARSIPMLTLVAFAPVVVRAFAQVLRPSRELNLKKIGWLEVTYSIVFLVIVSLSFV